MTPEISDRCKVTVKLDNRKFWRAKNYCIVTVEVANGSLGDAVGPKNGKNKLGAGKNGYQWILIRTTSGKKYSCV